MIVRMGLLQRKAGLEAAEFRSHWRNFHGPLAAKLPGLRASGPYSSNVDSDSFERSVSSGTDACMRNASSYCAIRVKVSGCPNSSAWSWFS